MRILFMGTPAFAAASLEALIGVEQFDIIGVITQPDRPKGRGMNLQSSEVKLLAQQHQLPLWQPERVDTPEFLQIFDQLNPDIVVVVAFGQKIPAKILFEPICGCVNVHGSLLPKYRGAAPIQWSILNGDQTTGVTTMYMDEGWDTGDLIYQESLTIPGDQTFCELYQNLAELGGKLLVKTLLDIKNGVAPRIPQDHTQATTAPKLKTVMEHIDWNVSGQMIYNKIRLFTPTPGAETFFNGERLKVIKAHFADESVSHRCPGEIINIDKKIGIAVATSDQSLWITAIQPVGKKIMSAIDFANGRRLKSGMIFGETDYIII